MSEPMADVKHFDVAEFELEVEVDGDELAKVADYYSLFADTRNEKHEVLCPGCGRVLYGAKGPIWQAMGVYTFTWGLVHGEGKCGDCGWPARGWPAHELGDGRSVTFPLPLPYHPDEVTS